MLVKFNDGNGTPVYVNPRYVVAVREEKHFGRPGVGSESEYHDTLILMTRFEFNVQEPLDEVARAIECAMEEARADQDGASED